MGPHTRVAHMPILALPVWPTQPGPKSTCPTWPSPYGQHNHTQVTTRLCLAHGHA
ncbi:hypothetical protein PVK06_048077 [Gossypium arboreum]|uniref:Uncharacterized protein n=1 Tax=Gossypium arboreum TaxID=29729 RepID=A0ABR0MFF6_GOSAR|nr:hypothetical protein PVK06_048077 [Gossypium arboreum]